MPSAERLATVLFVVFILLALSQPAVAAPPIFVGHGTPGSCTEMALKDALIIAETIGGATIQFKCGPQPVTMALRRVTTSPGFPVLLVLPNNTTIDGGGLITLDGTFTATVVFVDRDTTVVLTRLSIIRGFGGQFRLERMLEGLTGAAIENDGTLIIDHSTLSDNGPTSDSGGAVWNSGTLTVQHSTFSGNQGHYWGWGGIANVGVLTVQKSSFEDNFSPSWGGGIFNSGTLTVDDSTFSGNFAQGFGGGIFNLGGTLTVDKSTFVENVAVEQSGGAIYTNSHTATIDKSTLSGNRSTIGGGIFSFGTLTVRNSTFVENSGPRRWRRDFRGGDSHHQQEYVLPQPR